jgi:hypothetical protein
MAADPLHNFANPVMSAAIVKPDGTRIPLWVNPFESAEAPSMLPITDMIIQVGLDKVPKISATIALPFDDLIKLLQGTAHGKGIAWLEDNIEVQFGYVGASGGATLSPVFSAFLDKPEVNIGTDSTVGLTGIGVAAWSATRQGRGRAFKEKPRFDVMEELLRGPAADAPRPAELDTELVRSGPGPGSPAWKALFEDKVTIAPGYTSDYHMLLRLAKESFCWLRYGYDGDTKKDIIQLVPFSAALEPPRHRFQMFTGSSEFGPGNGLYPLLSFNSPTTGVYYASEARGKYLMSINSETGEAETTYVGNEDKKGAKPVNNTGSGGGQPKSTAKTPKPDEEKGDGVAPGSGDQANERTINRLRSEATKAMNAGMGVKIEFETLGVPNLYPGDLIEIVGLSDLFSYNYRVFDITHTLGTGGYTSSVVAQSNTPLTLEAVMKAAGETNKEPADIEEESGNSTEGGPG